MESQLARRVRQRRHDCIVLGKFARMLGPAAPVQVVRRSAHDDFGARQPPGDEVARRAALRPSIRIVTSKFSSTVSTGPGTENSNRHAREAGAKARQVLGDLVHREGRRQQHAHLAARLGGGGSGQRVGLLDLDQDVSYALQVGSPASVSASRRVVRLIRRAPRCSSSSATRRVTTAGARSSARAAFGEAAFVDDAGEDPHGS